MVGLSSITSDLNDLEQVILTSELDVIRARTHHVLTEINSRKQMIEKEVERLSAYNKSIA